jgi:hypothetical protein
MKWLGVSLMAMVAVSIALAVPSFARAGTIYVDGNAGSFGTVDLATGNFTYIGTTSQVLFGMGFTPDGTLYGLDGGANAHLWQVNTATGGLTDLGAVGHSVVGATVGPDGLIYAIEYNASGLLYTINPSTMAVTPIGNTGILGNGLVAFDSNGVLYMNSQGGGNDILYSIDPTTGTPSLIGPTNLAIFTGVFNLGDGNLYGFANDTGIYSLDTTSGASTLVSFAGFPSEVAYAAADFEGGRTQANPEPSTILLVGIGSLALAGYTYRRRK